MSNELLDHTQAEWVLPKDPVLAIGLLEASLGEWHEEKMRLMWERGNCARADKAGAKDLLARAALFDQPAKRAKAFLKEQRLRLERKERHGLWASAVTALFGADALPACQAWMSAERKRLQQQEPVTDALRAGKEETQP